MQKTYIEKEDRTYSNIVGTITRIAKAKDYGCLRVQSGGMEFNVMMGYPSLQHRKIYFDRLYQVGDSVIVTNYEYVHHFIWKDGIDLLVEFSPSHFQQVWNPVTNFR